MAARPSGWPDDLPIPNTDEFDGRVVGWLLDRGPSHLRGSGLERHPLALAFVVDAHCRASVDALRECYARVRSGLATGLTPEALEETLRALEWAGARSAQEARHTSLVREAIERSSPRIVR